MRKLWPWKKTLQAQTLCSEFLRNSIMLRNLKFWHLWFFIQSLFQPSFTIEHMPYFFVQYILMQIPGCKRVMLGTLPKWCVNDSSYEKLIKYLSCNQIDYLQTTYWRSSWATITLSILIMLYSLICTTPSSAVF